MSYYTQLWDKEWLYEHYVTQNLNANAIAEIVGCNRSSVLTALKRNGIETKSNSEAQKASIVPKQGSSAPRPRAKFKDTLHNLEWLKTNWLDCMNESEVGRREGASPPSANKALQKLFESDPTIPRFKAKGPGVRVIPFQARPGRRTSVEPPRSLQYQDSARIFEGMDKTCALCGDVGQYKKEVNHKDRSPWNNDPSNLESLCVKCHRYQHTGEEWAAIEFALDQGLTYMDLHNSVRKDLLAGVDIKERVLLRLRPGNLTDKLNPSRGFVGLELEAAKMVRDLLDEGYFDELGSVLLSLDVWSIPPEVLLSILSASRWYRTRIRYRNTFIENVQSRLSALVGPELAYQLVFERR